MGRLSQAAITVLFTAALAATLFNSYRITTGLFGLENDSIQAAILWDGLHHYGPSFIAHWHFTPDNWLFSITPINFATFATIGFHPYAVIIEGWLIMVASALVSGHLAWQLGARRATLLLPLALLCLGFYAQRQGFAAYAAAHNITNLFGLVTLSLTLSYIAAPRLLRLAGILLVLTAGALSDPWMLPAYSAPLAALSLLLFIWPPQTIRRWHAALLLAITLLSLAICATHGFGHLSFLPRTSMRPGPYAQMNDNAVFLLKDLGALLNLIPGRSDNDFIMSLLSLGIISLLACSLAARHAAETWRLEEPGTQLLAFATISAAATCAAFVTAQVPAADYSGRFLLNCLYLTCILTAVLIDRQWPALTLIGKFYASLVAVLFVMSGLTTTITWPDAEGAAPYLLQEHNTLNFLRANHLTYGYGPFWGAETSTVTLISHGTITLRPVTFDPVTGQPHLRQPETSAFWTPPGGKNFFIMVMNDGEECPDVTVCLEGVTKEFGKPAQMLMFQGAYVMVWKGK
jgi:hypothetical protein